MRRPAVSQLPSVTPGALFLPLRSHPSTERSNFARARASEIRGFLFASFRANPSSVLLQLHKPLPPFLPFRFDGYFERFNATCARGKISLSFSFYMSLIMEYSRSSNIAAATAAAAAGYACRLALRIPLRVSPFSCRSEGRAYPSHGIRPESLACEELARDCDLDRGQPESRPRWSRRHVRQAVSVRIRRPSRAERSRTFVGQAAARSDDGNAAVPAR